MEKITTISVRPETANILKKMAEIKRWKTITFCDYLAELFNAFTDGNLTKNIPIEDLRQAYDFNVAVYPTNRGEHNVK